jgi:diadenosine tetraphosphate (Ap4A) HIT family hydrolase
MSDVCPFCTIPDGDVIGENTCHRMIRDRFPVAVGHSLIIPKRHVASLFELTAEEFNALHELLHSTRAQLDAEYQPDGYNIGVSVGAARNTTA